MSGEAKSQFAEGFRLRPIVLLMLGVFGVWGGYKVFFALWPSRLVNTHAPTAQKSEVGKLARGPVKLPPTHAQVPTWARQQSHLHRRITQAQNRTVHLDYVYRILKIPFVPFGALEHYGVSLVAPVPGTSFKLGDNAPPCIGFSWTEAPVRDVRYAVEVSKARDFSFFRTFGSSSTHAYLSVPIDGDFFWRVRATQGKVAVLSQAHSFLVVQPPISKQDAYQRSLATRIVDPQAWLATLAFCR